MKKSLLCLILLLALLLAGCSFADKSEANTNNAATDLGSSENSTEKNGNNTFTISYELGNMSEREKAGFLLELPSQAVAGEVVGIITAVLYDGDYHVFANGEEVKKTHSDSDYWAYTFTMPACDVVITMQPFTKSEIWGVDSSEDNIYESTDNTTEETASADATDTSENNALPDATQLSSYADILALYSYCFNNFSEYSDSDGYDILSEGFREVALNGQAGYALQDISGDGNAELIIAVNEEANDRQASRILAIYGMSPSGPIKVIEGWERSRIYVLDNNQLYKEGSSGAAYSGWEVGALNISGTEYEVQKCIYSEYEKIYCNTTGNWTYNEDELTDISAADAFNEGQEYLLKAQLYELTSIQ